MKKKKLAYESRVGINTIRSIEKGAMPKLTTLVEIMAALEMRRITIEVT